MLLFIELVHHKGHAVKEAAHYFMKGANKSGAVGKQKGKSFLCSQLPVSLLMSIPDGWCILAA